MESLDRFLLVAATISFPATMDIVAVDGSDACDVDGRTSRLKQRVTLCSEKPERKLSTDETQIQLNRMSDRKQSKAIAEH